MWGVGNLETDCPNLETIVACEQHKIHALRGCSVGTAGPRANWEKTGGRHSASEMPMG